MATVTERLKELIDLYKIKPIDLSIRSGVSKSSISDYLSGKTEPKRGNIYKIAKGFNISEAWLLGLDVPMSKKHEENRKSTSSISNAFPIPDTPISVPVLGRISAGLPLLAVENIIAYEFAPSSCIKEGYDYFYLKVQGDSMNLKFNDGDIVLVQQQNTLENGEIGVILVNGDDATVKKFRNENGIIILEPMSTNSEHHVQIYNPKEIEIRILGKVVSYQGKL